MQLSVLILGLVIALWMNTQPAHADDPRIVSLDQLLAEPHAFENQLVEVRGIAYADVGRAKRDWLCLRSFDTDLYHDRPPFCVFVAVTTMALADRTGFEAMTGKAVTLRGEFNFQTMLPDHFVRLREGPQHYGFWGTRWSIMMQAYGLNWPRYTEIRPMTLWWVEPVTPMADGTGP